MGDYKDQHKNVISKDELFTQLSEAILANLMVFDAAGISRKEVTTIVGADGGTIIGGEATFQTPVTRTLSKEDGKRLFETYADLLRRYDEGLLSADKIKNIRERHNFDRKVAAMRQSNSANN